MQSSTQSVRPVIASLLALLLIGAGLIAAPAAVAAPGQTVTLGFVSATETTAENAGQLVGAVRVITSDGDPLEAPVTFSFTFAGGTATDVLDVLVPTGTMNFTAATPVNTPLPLVSVINDAITEANESVLLTLSAVTGATVTTASTTITITNDDIATVTVDDVSASESSSPMTFTVRVDRAVQGGFELNYTTTPLTATAGADYTTSTGTLTFSGFAGESHVLSVPVSFDTLGESDETFRISFPSALSSVAPGALVITDTATGTIVNDDSAAVTIESVLIGEGNSGTTVATFTATLNAAVAGGFTINYATADGTATVADGDYEPATGTLVFVGTAGETRTFTVTINGDTKAENNETFTVSLNSASNASVDATDTALNMIFNDDLATVTIADVSLTEGNAGTTSVVFTATVDNAVQGGFTVDYATTAGTASAGGDYLSSTGTLVFAGTAGETQTFIVTVNGDTSLEADETLTVGLNSASTGLVIHTDTATGTILNDDGASLSIADVSVTEGNAGSTVVFFTATLDNAVPGGFTVDFATANGSAIGGSDYGSISGTGSFTGTPGETLTIPVTIFGDGVVEPDETLTVSFSGVSNSGVDVSDTATGTILNDDAASVSIADAGLSEGNAGSTVMTFTATVTGATAGSFTVPYTVTGVTATAGSDFTASSGTLTFSGTDGDVQIFTVAITGDTRVEANETFTVSLGTASLAGVVTSDTATGTISNDDTATVTVSNASATEGSTVTFTLTLDNAVDGGVDVPWLLSAGTAGATDLALGSGVVSFTGAAGESIPIIVPTLSDTVVEGDETFTLSLGAASVPAVDTSDTATGTIDDEDVLVVMVSPVSPTAPEGGTVEFAIMFSDPIPASSTLTLTLGHAGVAASGVDYSPGFPLTGTYFGGSTGSVLSFAVTDDALLEGDEDVTMTLSNPTVNGTPFRAQVTVSAATATIVDNETTTVGITADQATASEGSAAPRTFTVRLGLVNNTSGPITVGYTTGGTAVAGDVAPLSGTASIPVGDDSATITVEPLADSLVEGDETLTLTLTSVSMAAVSLAAAPSATMTILDANAAPAAASPSLARAGTDSLPMLLIAALLVAIGGVILIARRRRAAD